MPTISISDGSNNRVYLSISNMIMILVDVAVAAEWQGDGGGGTKPDGHITEALDVATLVLSHDPSHKGTNMLNTFKTKTLKTPRAAKADPAEKELYPAMGELRSWKAHVEKPSPRPVDGNPPISDDVGGVRRWWPSPRSRGQDGPGMAKPGGLVLGPTKDMTMDLNGYIIMGPEFSAMDRNWAWEKSSLFDLCPQFTTGFTPLGPNFTMGFTLLGPNKIVQHNGRNFPVTKPDSASPPKENGGAASA